MHHCVDEFSKHQDHPDDQIAAPEETPSAPSASSIPLELKAQGVIKRELDEVDIIITNKRRKIYGSNYDIEGSQSAYMELDFSNQPTEQLAMMALVPWKSGTNAEEFNPRLRLENPGPDNAVWNGLLIGSFGIQDLISRVDSTGLRLQAAGKGERSYYLVGYFGGKEKFVEEGGDIFLKPDIMLLECDVDLATWLEHTDRDRVLLVICVWEDVEADFGIVQQEA